MLRCGTANAVQIPAFPADFRFVRSETWEQLWEKLNSKYHLRQRQQHADEVDSTGTTTYTWDFENRLTSITLPGTGGTISFKYDPFGRRVYRSSSSATSIYAYDGDNLWKRPM